MTSKHWRRLCYKQATIHLNSYKHSTHQDSPQQPLLQFTTHSWMQTAISLACNTTWFWSSVECYLIQSPTIFLYTSLFFTIPQDRTTTANIIFKDNCRDLVTWNEDGTCTCTSNSLLDILTQQVSILYTHAHLECQHKHLIQKTTEANTVH